MRSHQESRHNFNTLNLAQRTRTRTSCGPSRPAGRSNSRVVVLKPAASRELKGPQKATPGDGVLVPPSSALAGLDIPGGAGRPCIRPWAGGQPDPRARISAQAAAGSGRSVPWPPPGATQSTELLSRYPSAAARPGCRPHLPVLAASRVPGRQAGYPPDGAHVRGRRRTRAGAPGSGTARPGAPAPGVLARGLDARAGRSVHRPHRTDSRRGQDTIAPARRTGRSRV
jgi:hypothetical protein